MCLVIAEYQDVITSCVLEVCCLRVRTSLLPLTFFHLSYEFNEKPHTRLFSYNM
jgi:hypothetical protein